MRSRSWLAALLLAGCGNYSTEDVRFFAAVPSRGMLRVAVPAPAPQALASCTYGSADAWLQARSTGDAINAGVDAILGLVDLIRTFSPTERKPSARIWGPFDDRRHPGREDLITITRQDGGCVPGGPVCYQYAFQARLKGQGVFQNILDGQFQGASAESGDGSLQIHFDTIWALGMNNADSPHGEMAIAYSRRGDPHTIDLSLQQPGFGLPQFDYAWQGFANGDGVFDYRFVDAAGNVLTINSRFDAAGEGRADVIYVLAGGGFSAGFQECWDAVACVSWVDDPYNFTKLCPSAPCLLGQPSACAVQ